MALIAEGKAYPKPNAFGELHIKTVNDIDVKYLGYPPDYQYQGVLADSQALQAAFDANKAKIPPALLPYVEERLQSRLKDWGTYNSKFEQWSKPGVGMDCGADYTQNPVPSNADITQPGERKVPFRTLGANGYKGYRVIEFDAGAGYKSFTGGHGHL